MTEKLAIFILAINSSLLSQLRFNRLLRLEIKGDKADKIRLYLINSILSVYNDKHYLITDLELDVGYLYH